MGMWILLRHSRFSHARKPLRGDGVGGGRVRDAAFPPDSRLRYHHSPPSRAVKQTWPPGKRAAGPLLHSGTEWKPPGGGVQRPRWLPEERPSRRGSFFFFLRGYWGFRNGHDALCFVDLVGSLLLSLLHVFPHLHDHSSLCYYFSPLLLSVSIYLVSHRYGYEAILSAF